MTATERILKSFKGAVLNGTLAHSHLIVGEKGLGKSIMAVKAARLIMDPSGEDMREHLIDITEIRIKEKSIGVDDVRRITEEALLKPFEGSKKVIIIHDGEKMTVQAQNALLKTIEEPPEGVYFIILAEKKEDLLPTVVSRCQVIRLSPLSDAEMRQYLTENYRLPPDKTDEIINISQGIPGNADSFLNDDDDRKLKETMITLLERLAPIKSMRDRNTASVMVLNRAVLKNPEGFFKGLIALIRDMAVIKSTGHYKKLIFLYNEERIRETAYRFSMVRLMGLLEISQEALSLLEKGRNINRETVTDYILLRMLEDSSE